MVVRLDGRRIAAFAHMLLITTLALFISLANSGMAMGRSTSFIEICADGGTQLIALEADETEPNAECIHCSVCMLNASSPILDTAQHFDISFNTMPTQSVALNARDICVLKPALQHPSRAPPVQPFKRDFHA
uniref:DUF2946 family protein n=2 Tax=Halocynthiibacter sp. C4 TaxID=2992758 RepID=UPI00315849C5